MATHTLTEAMGETITMDDFTPTLEAGDTVIISPSRTSAIKLYQIVGSSGSWIKITNPSDAKITLLDNGTISTAIQVDECRYINLCGNNYNSETYGIKLTGDSAAALRAVNTRDITASYLELAEGGLNMSQCWSPWTCTEEMENVAIHHNYIHDPEGEGMYLGKSSRSVAPKFRDIQIYNNIIQDCGWDGIQLGQTIGENNNIYNNTIKHTGHGGAYKWCWATEQYQTDPCPGQWFGIVINPEHYGVHVYRNYIEDPYYTGISISSNGDGPIDIHDNVVWGAGGNGIGVGIATGASTIINNTVVNSTKYGIGTPEGTTAGELRYNLLIANGWVGINSDYTTQNDNRTSSSISDENFVDAVAGNFRLTESSPARNEGTGEGYSTVDCDGNARPEGSAPDIGAFEYLEDVHLPYTRYRGILRQKPKYNMVGGRF